MSRQSLLAVFLFFFSIHCAIAQGIKGRITNSRGEPVPYANVYVPALSTGTTSNIEGFYELKLPEGKQNVLFQYLGYQTQTRYVQVGKAVQEVNVQLMQRNYRIPEIKVLASGEDPAYYIMRRAIAMAPYYQKQVSHYSCTVYLKGSGVFEKIPFLLEKQMKKGGVKENEPFVMETLSHLTFDLPDQVKQQVIAMHSSGKDNNTSPMAMITNSLYDSDKYGVVSPLGRNALKAYRFRLDGVFEDQGRTINKICVIPKTHGKDVFSGYIYIADLFWNIHSADLQLHVPMTDIKLHQLYGEVAENTWMPVSLDFDIDFSGLGFKMNYRYVASVSDYKTTLNPALDHSFLARLEKQQIRDQQFIDSLSVAPTPMPGQSAKETPLSKKMDEWFEKDKLSNHEARKLNRLMAKEARKADGAEPLEIKSFITSNPKQVKNDSAYWANVRPIPLTSSEKVSFDQKSEYLKQISKPEFQDSVRNSKRKFKPKHLIFGKTYDYSSDTTRDFRRFSIPGLIRPATLSFNSVDGFRLTLPFSYWQSDSLGHYSRLSTGLAWAFARQKFDASVTYQHRFDGMRNTWLSLGAGTTTNDYNRTSGLSAATNDFYTLWLEQNFNRYYRRDFLQVASGIDIANGLNLAVSADYSNNIRLSNHSHYSFIKYADREIQPNIPANMELQNWQLDDHQSLLGQIRLEYTPRFRYLIRNHVKIYVHSRYPTWSLAYETAISGVGGSDSRFDLLKVAMRQKIDFGIADHFSYTMAAGAFLNTSRIYFEDFRHFDVKSTGFMFATYENSFRLLPFYAYSTQRNFAEMHATWQSGRLFIKQLPAIRNSSVSENLFLNALSTRELPAYFEGGYGLDNLFLLLNVEAVAGFERGKFRSAGIRVSLNLK